ncbi:MAG: DNA-directed RNA polymerase subunit alpha, partial [Patescibacteria group bacterium]
TDPAGNLNMEIYIKPGRGYQISEGEKKANNEIGYIEVDAIFSPILAVSSNVENVRVGKMTNWDKLIVNIKTDGTITYEEAFKKSAEILIDQFNSLLSGPEAEVIAEEAEVIAEEAVEEVKEEVKEKKVKKAKK